MSPEPSGLVVEGLRVDAVGPGVDIVADVSFSVSPGSALGLVGESGCGKTTVAMALLGFARPGTRIAAGSVIVGGTDILALSERALRARRGRVLSFVPQNPSRALSPGMRVRGQLEEMVDVHVERDTDARRLLQTAWEGAQLPYAHDLLVRYPHQLSGGQQQRVAIAMALVCEPEVIVMDEPTTGLDVVTQARLLEVIRGVRSSRDACIVYISHDLSVVRNLVDHVAVMYGGRIVEEGAVDELFRAPRHPYTRRLLEAIPRVHTRSGDIRGIPGHAVEPWNRPSGCPFAPRCEFRVGKCDDEMPPSDAVDGRHTVRCWMWRELPSTDGTARHAESPARVAVSERDALSVPERAGTPILGVRDLVAGYRQGHSLLRPSRNWSIAVSGVSFEVQAGSCLAVVGESGSGKTTLGRCLAGLHAPISGEIRFAGQPLEGLARLRKPEVRRRIQIVFQDPDSSLNPSMTVGYIIRRPLRQFFRVGRRAESAKVAELLQRVHLSPRMASRLPQELSGGEKQRVAIARALAAEPEVLICDEVTSALDVAVQASILELLKELRNSTGMAMIFISHDLAVVRTISDSVLVMHQGEIREAAARDELFFRPRDAYTRGLLEAVPDLRDGDYPGADRLLELGATREGAS